MKKGDAMVLVKLEPSNAARFRKLKAAVAKLPMLEQRLWKARIVAKLKSGPTPVIGDATGEWGTTSPAQPEGEWDLEVANFLDDAYTAVADRVEELYAKGKQGLENLGKSAGKIASDVGFGVWPIAIAAALVLYAFASAKRA